MHVPDEKLAELYEVIKRLVDVSRDYMHFRREEESQFWETDAILVQVRLTGIEDILNPDRLHFGSPARYEFSNYLPVRAFLREIRWTADDILRAIDLIDLAHTRPTDKPLWARSAPLPGFSFKSLIDMHWASCQLAASRDPHIGHVTSELPARREQECPLQVDRKSKQAILDGITYECEDGVGLILQMLIADGGWLSSTELAQLEPLLKGVRIDRDLKRLPTPIRSLLESRSGKGYRLRWESVSDPEHADRDLA